VFESPLAASLDAVVSRARSLQLGVQACCSLPVPESVQEARLVLLTGLRRCTSELQALVESDAGRGVDALLLLAAERYWIEALLTMLEPGAAAGQPATELLDRVLEAFPAIA
jgi:hypothetical protein